MPRAGKSVVRTSGHPEERRISAHWRGRSLTPRCFAGGLRMTRFLHAAVVHVDAFLRELDFHGDIAMPAHIITALNVRMNSSPCAGVQATDRSPERATPGTNTA